ncbi:hypothetical protein CBW53_19380 [Yersinia frederiksenii]|nr:hypothetical protein CBW53_19380 [Yersinia frederiksenii]
MAWPSFLYVAGLKKDLRYAFNNLLDFLNRNLRSDQNVNFEAFLLIFESPYTLYNTYLSYFQV